MTDLADSIADWAKKSSISWIRFQSGLFQVWHVWADDAVCVVGSTDGILEQPLPPVHDGERAVVSLRTKSDRALAAEIPVRIEILHPDSTSWEPITSALKSARQNATDLSSLVERWAGECQVLRLVPEGDVVEAADVDPERPRTLPRLS